MKEVNKHLIANGWRRVWRKGSAENDLLKLSPWKGRATQPCALNSTKSLFSFRTSGTATCQ